MRIECNCELNIQYCWDAIELNRRRRLGWKWRHYARRQSYMYIVYRNPTLRRIESSVTFRFRLEFTSFNIITVIICETDQIVEANGYLCVCIRCAVVRFVFASRLFLLKTTVSRFIRLTRCQFEWWCRVDSDSTAQRWNVRRYWLWVCDTSICVGIAYTIYVYISRQWSISGRSVGISSSPAIDQIILCIDWIRCMHSHYRFGSNVRLMSVCCVSFFLHFVRHF